MDQNSFSSHWLIHFCCLDQKVFKQNYIRSIKIPKIHLILIMSPNPKSITVHVHFFCPISISYHQKPKMWLLSVLGLYYVHIRVVPSNSSSSFLSTDFLPFFQSNRLMLVLQSESILCNIVDLKIDFVLDLEFRFQFNIFWLIDLCLFLNLDLWIGSNISRWWTTIC